MAHVSKIDVEILTTQVLKRKCEILEYLKSEHTNIDPSLQSEFFLPHFEQKLHKTEQLLSDNQNVKNIVILNLDVIEEVLQRYDILEKHLQEPKASTIISTRKDGIKRFGSMTDINKTLMRSLSSQNLNTTKLFAEPQAPAPRTGINCNFTIVSGKTNQMSRLSFQQLSEHNNLTSDIQRRLDLIQSDYAKSHPISLADIEHKFTTSFDRLNKFFIEVKQIQKNDDEMEHVTPLKDLDENLLKSMSKLSEALTQVRFIAENKNPYNASVKSVDSVLSVLSDDLTEILENFYSNAA